MSIEDFQLIDNIEIDNSIIKRDFTKIYHQQGAQLNDPDQNIEFIFGENGNYHQVGNGYLEFTITLRNNGGNFADANEIRLVNNAFAYCFKNASISTTSGSEIEINKYPGVISTIMRVLTSKDGDIISYFDKIDETQINNTSLKNRLINNHTVAANKGKITDQLPLEHIFGFCKTFKKVTKGLGFHISFKTADLQDLIFTTIATNINIEINSLYLFVPTFIPSAETQVMFNDSIKNSFNISFDSWTTDRKIVNTDLEYQLDIGSSANINSPKYLIVAHQTAARSGASNKANNISIFDNLDIRKYFVEIDGIRYPKDSVHVNYTENDYLDQYRDIKLFYKEYLGEELMNPFIKYDDVKNTYPIQVIDLRFQVDHINPKKIQLFEEYRANPNNARLFLILIRHREIKMVSDGNKITEIKVI